MPLFDFKCSAKHLFEALAPSDTERIRCRHCKRIAHRVFVSRSTYERLAQPFNPVVVFRKADGSYSIPGDASKPTPKGCERVELRTMTQVRRFENEMTAKESARHEDRREREQQQFEHVQSLGRSLLRQRMQKFSEQGKDFARYVMEEHNRTSGERRFDAGCHIDVFSYNPSNMDARHKE